MRGNRAEAGVRRTFLWLVIERVGLATDTPLRECEAGRTRTCTCSGSTEPLYLAKLQPLAAEAVDSVVVNLMPPVALLLHAAGAVAGVARGGGCGASTTDAMKATASALCAGLCAVFELLLIGFEHDEPSCSVSHGV